MKEASLRTYAALASLLVGLLVMGLKFLAYQHTGSTAILSDALENVVNVVTAGFTLWAVRAAEEPPDQEHPYGHGKLEFMTAVFEGGLITFASLLIAYEAILAIARPTPLDFSSLHSFGLLASAGALNALLGLFLLRTGRKTASPALVADGHHVASDSLSTLGILAGLGLVWLTGYLLLDALIALGIAILLAKTGVSLLQRSVNGLIDAADPTLLQTLCDAFEAHRKPGMIRVHHVRAMRNGRRIHVDGHIVVPEFWSVEQAHDEADAYEARMKLAFPESEMEFHLDPCRQAYCRSCEMRDCPIRLTSFTGRPPLTLQELQSTVDITDRQPAS